MSFNITNFFQNVSRTFEADRNFLHQLTDDVPIAQSIAIPFEEILTIGKKATDIASKVSAEFVEADKNQKKLTDDDLKRKVHIFGKDIDIPKTQLEVLFELGRRDPEEKLKDLEDLGRRIDKVKGIIT